MYIVYGWLRLLKPALEALNVGEREVATLIEMSRTTKLMVPEIKLFFLQYKQFTCNVLYCMTHFISLFPAFNSSFPPSIFHLFLQAKSRQYKCTVA